MGIRPYANGQTPPPAPRDNTESRYGSWVGSLDNAGSKFGDGLAAVDAMATSANSGAGELAADLTALEGQPLLLWWSGEGSPPPLKPGWGLYNIATGEVTF